MPIDHALVLFFLSGILALLLSPILFPPRDAFLDKILASDCLKKLTYNDLSTPISIDEPPFSLVLEGPLPPEVFANVEERLPRHQLQVHTTRTSREIYCRIGTYWVALEGPPPPSKQHDRLPEYLILTLIDETPVPPSRPLTLPPRGSGFDKGVVYYIKPRECHVEDVLKRLSNGESFAEDAPQCQPLETAAAINLATRLWQMSERNTPL